jgi:large subunit ribosomal protein L10
MRPEKASIVEDLQTKLNASPFLFVADYTGLKVSQFAELRNRLDGAGARCHVVKNTFLRRAAREAGLPELGELGGQTAIVVDQDRRRG